MLTDLLMGRSDYKKTTRPTEFLNDCQLKRTETGFEFF